jgi:hypothetical protein
MSLESLKEAVRKHCEEQLPNEVAELRRTGALNQALQAAAQRAQREIEYLMQQGYPREEAESVVLHQFILLPSEVEEESVLPELWVEDVLVEEVDYEVEVRDILKDSDQENPDR